MPVYSMRDNTTQKEFEVTMKYAELEAYLNDNPNIQQIFTRFPGFGDPVSLGLKKPDDNFRDVLRNVQSHHKKDSINTF
jgi:hypothetical protein